GRATRQLRASSPLGVSGSATVLAELVRTAVLKLDRVQAVILAWGDDILAAGGATALEGLLGELPKDGSRVLVTGRMTDELEQLVERYMRRPRRVTEGDTDAPPPLTTPVQYVTVSDTTRASTLRRLLDELNPEHAAIAAW